MGERPIFQGLIPYKFMPERPSLLGYHPLDKTGLLHDSCEMLFLKNTEKRCELWFYKKSNRTISSTATATVSILFNRSILLIVFSIVLSIPSLPPDS